MSTLPTLPSDSVYKFLAIFGVVCLIFSLTFTDSQTEKYSEEYGEALKNFQIANVRFLHKAKALDAVIARVGNFIKENKNGLDSSRQTLDQQGEALRGVLADIEKFESSLNTGHQTSDPNEIERVRTLSEKLAKEVAEESRNVQRLGAEGKALLGQNLPENTERTEERKQTVMMMRQNLDSLQEEMEISKIERKDLDGKWQLLKLKFEVSSLSGNVTFFSGMLFTASGFWLWWSRIQVFQDMILRKQARDTGFKMPRRRRPKPEVVTRWRRMVKHRWKQFFARFRRNRTTTEQRGR